jgi:hypothetical protein
MFFVLFRDLTTPEQVKAALHAPVPRWAGFGHEYLTKVTLYTIHYTL